MIMTLLKGFVCFILLKSVYGQRTCPAAQSKVCNVYPGDYKSPIPTCGSQGTVPARAKNAVITGPCVSSYPSCRNSCLGNTACQSFAVNSRSGTCTLYSKKLADIGFTRDGSAPQRFYNRNCFAFQSCVAPGPTEFKLVVAANNADSSGDYINNNNNGVGSTSINVLPPEWGGVESADVYMLDGDKLVDRLVRPAYVALEGTTAQMPYVFLQRNDTAPDASRVLHCTGGAIGSTLACHSTSGYNQFARCNDNNGQLLRILNPQDPPPATPTCYPLTIKVVAAS